MWKEQLLATHEWLLIVRCNVYTGQTTGSLLRGRVSNIQDKSKWRGGISAYICIFSFKRLPRWVTPSIRRVWLRRGYLRRDSDSKSHVVWPLSVLGCLHIETHTNRKYLLRFFVSARREDGEGPGKSPNYSACLLNGRCNLTQISLATCYLI